MPRPFLPSPSRLGHNVELKSPKVAALLCARDHNGVVRRAQREPVFAVHHAGKCGFFAGVGWLVAYHDASNDLAAEAEDEDGRKEFSPTKIKRSIYIYFK